ncbi:MAG: CPBP family intramembrane metalloprotease [Clostridia bacterium]|nr:CPBP family intramembrane metalloprotease [Clostridia bacterium]
MPLIRALLAHLTILLLLLTCGFIYERTGFGDTLWDEVLTRVVFSAAMTAFLLSISGTKHLQLKNGAVRHALKMCAPLLIFAGFLTFLFLTDPETRGTLSVTPGLLSGTLLCVTVGIFEETAYRAVIYDGIAGFTRNTRGTYTASAVVSFILFGVSHVLNELLMPETFTEPTLLMQVLLKITQTGLIGLIMMLIYVRTGTVWAPAAAHALFDLLLCLPELLTAADISMEYVSVEDAAGGIRSYVIMILIELVIYLRLRGKHLSAIRAEETAGEKEL